jgi:hypothetical protein
MITLTAVGTVLLLGWGIQYLWKRAVRAASAIAKAKPVVVNIAPTKS